MSSANNLTASGWIWYQTNTVSSLSRETDENNVYSGDQALLINNFTAEPTDYVVLGLPLSFTTSNPNHTGRSVDLRLIGPRGNDIDMARLRFGHGNNLRKMQLNPNHTKVYIPQGNDDFAVAFTEREQGEIPVNFKAEKNGIYTLTIPTLNSQLSTLNFKYLHLIDNLTGNDVDLLQTPSYTFEAKHSDYASRFKLVFMADEGTAEAGSDTFAFISDGNLIVYMGAFDASQQVDARGASLQVVDMMGRILLCRDAQRASATTNASATSHVSVLSTEGLASGVYVLRLIHGDEVKT